VSVGNIARTYASQGDIANALAFQRRADAILETQMSLDLAPDPKRQKLAWCEASRSAPTGHFAASRQAPRDPGRPPHCRAVLLQRKGRVLDAMATSSPPYDSVWPIPRSDPDGRLNVTTTQLASSC